mgnify:CR=1 FL=1
MYRKFLYRQPSQSRNRTAFTRTVKVTLKTTLASSQNKHPPRTRNLVNRLFSPGVLPVPPTPLLVLAPDERRGDDQNFSKQTTHLLLLRSRELEKRPGRNSAGPRRIRRDPRNGSLLTGRNRMRLTAIRWAGLPIYPSGLPGRLRAGLRQAAVYHV